jgi:hypothetical protein
METTESVMEESFGIAFRHGLDFERFLKERTDELAMSNKLQSSLKNQMRENGEEYANFRKLLTESFSSIKKAMARYILTHNVFKPGTVKDYGTPNVTISTEGFEGYINQIFIRLIEKYFKCLNTIA